MDRETRDQLFSTLGRMEAKMESMMKRLTPVAFLLLLTSGCASSKALRLKLEAAESRAVVAEKMSEEYARDRDRSKDGWERAMKSLRYRTEAARGWKEIAEDCANRHSEPILYPSMDGK